MKGREPVPWAEIAAHVAENPVLADFARPFPKLVGDNETGAGRSFERMASSLSKSKRTGTIQFSLRDGRKSRQRCLAMTPDGCEVTDGAVKRPDLEILTDVDTWVGIAGGEVAPLEAFASGKVRLVGDLELARLLARRVRS